MKAKLTKNGLVEMDRGMTTKLRAEQFVISFLVSNSHRAHSDGWLSLMPSIRGRYNDGVLVDTLVSVLDNRFSSLF